MRELFQMRYTDEQYAILSAPFESEISLALVMAASGKALRLEDNRFVLGYPDEVLYKITGFDLERLTFQLERVDFAQKGRTS